MLKGAIVGALTLTMGMFSFAAADELGSVRQVASLQQPEQASGNTGPVIKETHIARLRAALNLKPEQQRHWAPVESALRALARQQSRDVSGAGLVQRISDKASAMAGTAVKLKRLASAAAPLIRVLDDSQKQSAMSYVHGAGFGHLAAAF